MTLCRRMWRQVWLKADGVLMIGRLAAGIAVGWVLVVMAGLVVVWGGVPNVAAGWRDPPPLQWLLHTAYERSVARRVGDVVVPTAAGDPGQALAGARAFDEMCAICHTPPGQEPTEQSVGLNPAPPRLTELTRRRTPAQAYWVMKNGVRMTAMPAFGPTHTDAELWQLVAFVQRARDLDAAGYVAMLSRAERLPASHDHGHRHGSGPDEAGCGPAGHHHDTGEEDAH
jgi:mono/diheme cytochrome c family protein